MISSIFAYVPTKSGVPAHKEIDPDEQYKKGWEKIPDTYDLKKEYIRISIKKWDQLSDEQRTGIQNHTFKYQTNLCHKGGYYGYLLTGNRDNLEYIYQENIGSFEIKYTGQNYHLFFNGIDLISPPTSTQDKPQKQITWLKRYTQYLTDESDQLAYELSTRAFLISPYLERDIAALVVPEICA